MTTPAHTTPAQDLYRDVILDGFGHAAIILDNSGGAASGIHEMAKVISELPKWLPQSTVSSLDIQELDLGPMVRRLLATCPELAHLAGRPIDCNWWTGKRNRHGKVLLGTAKVVSGKERDLWTNGVPPWWKVELSLPYWLLADDMERYRLLHHELMHCRVKVSGEDEEESPTVVSHDVEEFVSTVGRFGFRDAYQFALTENGQRHSEYEIRKRDWEFTIEGQGLLFGAWGNDGPELVGAAEDAA